MDLYRPTVYEKLCFTVKMVAYAKQNLTNYKIIDTSLYLINSSGNPTAVDLLIKFLTLVV